MGELSSEALAAVYGGVVGGVLGITGALMGAVVQNRLKRVGKVRGQIVSMGSGGSPNSDEVTLHAEVWFYNEEEVSIGIRDIIVRYYRRGEAVGALPLRYEGETETIRSLDLPPRKWVRLKVEQAVAGEQGRDMQRSEELEIYWVYASGKVETRKSTGGWDEGRIRVFRQRVRNAIDALRGR